MGVDDANLIKAVSPGNRAIARVGVVTDLEGRGNSPTVLIPATWVANRDNGMMDVGVLVGGGADLTPAGQLLHRQHKLLLMQERGEVLVERPLHTASCRLCNGSNQREESLGG